MANVNEKRLRAVTLMKQRAKKNQYTQGADRKYFFGKPDNDPANTSQKGYSDCSSAVRAAIKEAAGVDIGGNTSAQINNRSKIGKVVDETTGYYPDETKLLPGDCLYFKGNASHPLNVGHVEMYTGKNECYGHGSGKGPTKKNLRSYCKSRANSKKRYFMAVRWIEEEEEEHVALANALVADERVKIATGSWNVRTGPGTNYPSVGVVRGGEWLEKAVFEGWLPVCYGGEIRFISKKAVE